MDYIVITKVAKLYSETIPLEIRDKPYRKHIRSSALCDLEFPSLILSVESDSLGQS